MSHEVLHQCALLHTYPVLGPLSSLPLKGGISLECHSRWPSMSTPMLCWVLIGWQCAMPSSSLVESFLHHRVSSLPCLEIIVGSQPLLSKMNNPVHHHFDFALSHKLTTNSVPCTIVTHIFESCPHRFLFDACSC